MNWNNITNVPFATEGQAADPTNTTAVMNPLRTNQVVNGILSVSGFTTQGQVEGLINQSIGGLAGTGLTLQENTLNIDNPFNPSGDYANLRARATTKNDVELGNVQNFGIANSNEAIDDEVTNKYMTPQRTFEAIDNYFSAITLPDEGVSQQDLEDALAGIGGDGLLFDPIGKVYTLDYANNQEAIAGMSTLKVMTPAATKAVIDELDVEIPQLITETVDHYNNFYETLGAGEPEIGQRFFGPFA